MVYIYFLFDDKSFLFFFFLLAENSKSIRQKNRRRKYQHRFNKCLVELIEKYPPIPAHEYLVRLIFD